MTKQTNATENLRKILFTVASVALVVVAIASAVPNDARGGTGSTAVLLFADGAVVLNDNEGDFWIHGASNFASANALLSAIVAGAQHPGGGATVQFGTTGSIVGVACANGVTASLIGGSTGAGGSGTPVGNGASGGFGNGAGAGSTPGNASYDASGWFGADNTSSGYGGGSQPENVPSMVISKHLAVVPTLVRRGDTVRVSWAVDHAGSCVVSGSNGDSWASVSSGERGEVSSPIVGMTVFTLRCTALGGATPASLEETATVNVVPAFKES